METAEKTITHKVRSRGASLGIVTVIYILAAGIAVAAYPRLPGAWWLRLLLADVIATVVVFAFSCVFQNASVYDPYWSVQPPVILALYAATLGTGSAGAYALLAVAVWSIRLTGNWVYTFHGLQSYEDWRYTMLREKTGRLYPVVNFLGIHLVPTLIVWAAALPAVVLVREGADLNAGAAACITLCFGSVYLELSADMTMHRFRKEGTGGFNRNGLWKYSRHPNYLGEITFWWFLGLGMVCVLPERWYLLAGALANTVLFLSASIPMAEKRQSRKAGYGEYREATRVLLPIKK